MRYKSILAIVLMGLLTSHFSFAVDAKTYFREEGSILSFDRERRELVIGDSLYSLAKTPKIFSPAGQLLPVNVLKSGLTIRYNLTTPTGTKAAVIEEILIVPN
jgi:hypothetical protein